MGLTASLTHIMISEKMDSQIESEVARLDITRSEFVRTILKQYFKKERDNQILLEIKDNTERILKKIDN